MTPVMYCIKLYAASGFEHGNRSAGVRHLCTPTHVKEEYFEVSNHINLAKNWPCIRRATEERHLIGSASERKRG